MHAPSSDPRDSPKLRRGLKYAVIVGLIALFLYSNIAFRDECRAQRGLDVRCSTIETARYALDRLVESLRPDGPE